MLQMLCISSLSDSSSFTMVVIDCWSEETTEYCRRLLSAIALFDPHPHLIRLALISVGALPPLSVYLQSGPCWHSCEGGIPQTCVSGGHDFHWQNVTSEMFLPNCGPRHYCCITAAIGDCCSVYTNTTFMEDFSPDINDGYLPLNTFLLLAVFLVMFSGAGIYFMKKVICDRKRSLKWERDIKTVNTCDSQPLSGGEHGALRPVILLYIKEPNGRSFSDNVRKLKDFLSHTVRLRVIDIYEEEEEINTFGPDWFKRHDAQLVVVDSESSRGLQRGGHVLSPPEGSVRYILDWVTRCQQHSRLFVVSFQENKKGVTPFCNYGVSRSYVFPIQNHRLAEDLVNH